jgi:hypothetical protein
MHYYFSNGTSLGFSGWGLSSSNEGRKWMNSKGETRGMAQKVVLTFCPCPHRDVHAGLFIVEDSRSYYNALNTPDYLAHQ